MKAQRDAHFVRRPLRRASEDEDCSLDFHLAALRQAGFAEAAAVQQQLNNYVVFAHSAQAWYAVARAQRIPPMEPG